MSKTVSVSPSLEDLFKNNIKYYVCLGTPIRYAGDWLESGKRTTLKRRLVKILGSFISFIFVFNLFAQFHYVLFHVLRVDEYAGTMNGVANTFSYIIKSWVILVKTKEYKTLISLLFDIIRSEKKSQLCINSLNEVHNAFQTVL